MPTLIFVIAAIVLLAVVLLALSRRKARAERDRSGVRGAAAEPADAGARVEAAVRGAAPYAPAAMANAARRDPGLPPASENPGIDIPDDEQPASETPEAER